ncbi:hypothetical protein JR316_0008949 [Psilocybe cubensis]|uniref:Uncharacterized protein n=2 Tax=Psilocybe cubensis TaxID=181762 RepID=A0ACB8GSE4_PSICU|nr:hypothetical protein JR316_0008949 [Psilocybe cubensis]KAH9478494.1 hypothetical protein JR316_0008949 [Psilocybe cubensis]
MAPHRVAGAATVSPYVYDARQERATSGQTLVHASSPVSGGAGAVTSATAATNVNENADRGAPHGKGKKPKAKPRAERPPRQEEEMRFNTGPRSLRPPPASRGVRRGFRIPGRTYPEDQNGIPDYPPPSFQEAMTTPPVSVCSSTTSLPLAPTLPLIIPANIPEEPQVSIVQPVEEPRESIDQPVAQVVTTDPQGADNDVDFEGEMFIIDRNSVPVCSTDLPSGAALEERVKSDWLKRRGTEFPNKSSALMNHSSASKPLSDGINALTRGRSAKKLLTPLLIDPDPKNDDFGPIPVSPKRRFLSLSPLKTIFPPRSPVHEDRATLSAHPSPTSPYHTSRSIFFRSSSSLATASFLRLPLLSPPPPHTGKREPLSRRIFRRDRSKQNSDGLHQNAEPIETWEVVEEETYAGVDELGNETVIHPRSLLSAIESIQQHSNGNGDTSPTKSVSFSLGTPYMSDASRAKRSLMVPESSEEERRTLRIPSPQASQETFLRDWKGSSQLFLDRSVHRNRSPTPGASESTHRSPTFLASESTTSLNSGPPLVSVRVRAVSPSPAPSLTVLKHVAQVAHPSPLRLGTNTTHSLVGDQSAAEAAMYQKALDTPLPMTPTLYHQFDLDGSVAAFNDEDILSDLPVLSAGTSPRLLTNPISEDHHRIAPALTAAPATTTSRMATPPPPSGPSTMSVTTEVVKSNSLEEPITPSRHHYAGRPLPRPPPSASVPTNTNRVHVVDSVYASSDPTLTLRNNPLSTCPEGLLIDLEDTTLDTIPASRSSTPLSSERYTSQPHLPLAQVQAQASSSSVNLMRDPRMLNISSSRSPLSGSRHSPGAAIQQNSSAPNNVLSDLTDLDLLVSRLADADPNGTDYDVSSGHHGWNGTRLKQPPDASPAFRDNWASQYRFDLDDDLEPELEPVIEPEFEPEPQRCNRQPYNTYDHIQQQRDFVHSDLHPPAPQRQYLAHRAY